MFRSILVALCQREHSAPVIQQAIWLAKREGAQILGLYVLDEEELVPPAGVEGVSPQQWRAEVEPELKGFGQHLLAEFAAECARAGVTAETRLLVGPVARTICRQAYATDLIMMGRTGDYARRQSLLGCCPFEEVVRRATRPVLIAADAPRRIERILVAYDGSPRANVALVTAARLASDWQAPLLLITGIERKVGSPTLREALDYLRPYGQPEKALLREGVPAAEILRAIEEEGADLVVMGAYCHGRVQEMVIGGTVGQVVRETDRPVLIGC